MSGNKYQDIINKNPAESFQRSIKTKQAWSKYRSHFTNGMKRRKSLDKLTGNDEDKFDFKEKNKIDYQSSSTRYGQALRYIVAQQLLDLKPHPVIKGCDAYLGTVDTDDLKGTVDIILEEDGYVYLEHIAKESGEKHTFVPFLLPLIKSAYGRNYKGIKVLPLNKDLEDYYKSYGFVPYKEDTSDNYYVLNW